MVEVPIALEKACVTLSMGVNSFQPEEMFVKRIKQLNLKDDQILKVAI